MILGRVHRILPDHPSAYQIERPLGRGGMGLVFPQLNPETPKRSTWLARPTHTFKRIE
jgi:hypothetical protein